MRHFSLFTLLLLLALAPLTVCAQSQVGTTAQPRIRIIVDNDFGGDPDGLFQLAQQLLSPSAETRAIVCSHHYREFYGYPGNVSYAKSQVEALLGVMDYKGATVVCGSDSSLTSADRPLESEGVRAIVSEAMRDDKRPLYVVCGAALTNIASAYLMNPAIARRIAAVVWIGGPEYSDLCRNQLQRQREYNLGIDAVSAQVVFNSSDLNVWQIPRDVYRQALYSHAELQARVGTAGKTGAYLISRLDDLLGRAKGQLGEAYVLGDSPLVLVTALQSAWEHDAASCEYVVRKAPTVNSRGFYEPNPDGRPIRIFTKIDARLMLDDLVAKLQGYK